MKMQEKIHFQISHALWMNPTVSDPFLIKPVPLKHIAIVNFSRRPNVKLSKSTIVLFMQILSW